jgi:hypothetical protein
VYEVGGTVDARLVVDAAAVGLGWRPAAVELYDVGVGKVADEGVVGNVDRPLGTGVNVGTWA